MDTLAVRLTIPPVGLVGNFHPQVGAPCRAHQKKSRSLRNGSQPYRVDTSHVIDHLLRRNRTFRRFGCPRQMRLDCKLHTPTRIQKNYCIEITNCQAMRVKQCRRCATNTGHTELLSGSVVDRCALMRQQFSASVKKEGRSGAGRKNDGTFSYLFQQKLLSIGYSSPFKRKPVAKGDSFPSTLKGREQRLFAYEDLLWRLRR